MPSKILIIDDDEALCEELSESLKEAGYEVDTSFDGLEGKDLATSKHFDVLLLDINLPSLNGIEVLRHLKADHINTPVIVFTGSPDFDFNQILTLAYGFIIKPFDTMTLLKMVKMASQKSSSLLSH